HRRSRAVKGKRRGGETRRRSLSLPCSSLPAASLVSLVIITKPKVTFETFRSIFFAEVIITGKMRLFIYINYHSQEREREGGRAREREREGERERERVGE